MPLIVYLDIDIHMRGLAVEFFKVMRIIIHMYISYLLANYYIIAYTDTCHVLACLYLYRSLTLRASCMDFAICFLHFLAIVKTEGCEH